MATLVTVQSENGTFTVPFEVIQMSVTIKQMMDDLQITEETAHQMPIPIKKVDLDVATKIFEWCAHHKDGNNKILDGPLCPRFVEEEVIDDWVENKKLQEWDRTFLEKMQPDFLMQVLMDANYLHVKGLIELISYRIAEMMTGQSDEQLTENFGVVKDQTPEAIQAINEEVAWLNNSDTPQ